MGYPTNLTYGIATVPQQQPLGMYPLPDPFHTSANTGLDVVTYANDFFSIGTAVKDWTITGTSSTFDCASGLGGWVVLTPGGTTTASASYQTNQGFQFVSGQSFWYLCRMKVSAVSGNKSFYFGLRAGSSANDGIWFQKAAASTSLDLVSVVGSTSTTLVTGVTTAAADTWMDVGFYYDGTDLLVYSSDNLVARVTSPTIGASGTTLTNVLLGAVFQITPTATDTMTIDYVMAAQETTR
jgi:hypothetical protein